MADIRARIAALNLEQVHGATPGATTPYTFDAVEAPKKARPPPPPPPAKRPTVPDRPKSSNNPPLQSNGFANDYGVGNGQPDGPNSATVLPPSRGKLPPQPPPRPSLPPRPSEHGSKPPPPSLPPRRPSEQSVVSRKASTDSISSTASARTMGSVHSSRTSFSGTNGSTREDAYRVKAPAFDPSKLPPLPAKKESGSGKDDYYNSGRPSYRTKSSGKDQTKGPPAPAREIAPPPAPTRPARSPVVPQFRSENAEPVIEARQPPSLPSRPSLPARPSTVKQEPPQPAKPKRSALAFGMNTATETPPAVPTTRPVEQNGDTEPSGCPPPIPMASRPDLSAIMSSKPKAGAGSHCLICRDFSAVDAHAARFPRHAVPATDFNWLAHQLTSPFPSATDKARAIFTWLHHNIAYDVEAVYGNGTRTKTPEETVIKGMGVCAGYAGVFHAIAIPAGLECVIINGHGKGAGHKPLQLGDPVPAYYSTHAWNVVKIDQGEWKLLDSTWGAGHVKGAKPNKSYEKHFKPDMFTMSNNEFGLRHFPTDNSQQYRTDGRLLTWEQYWLDDMGERVQVYGNAEKEHGLGDRTFFPEKKHVRVYAPGEPDVVRFQFGYKCPHWDNARHGKGAPYVMLLKVGGRDGRNEDYIPFNTDGKMWWVDVRRLDLGAPGQQLQAIAVTTLDGSPGRGISVQKYKEKKGRCGMSFGGVCAWQLV